jgi:uncharacterized protein (UPF0261 family)
VAEPPAATVPVATVYVVGTCDTKGDELAYVRGLIRAAGVRAVLVDVGTRTPAVAADVPAEEVAAFHPDGAGAVLGLDDRGRAVAGMTEAFARFARSRTDVAGMIGLGGSGGTAIIAPGMRALPVGTPKLLVSTVASGQVAQYVGASDICMMYSVTDIAGLNRISRVVLANAAHAVAGMAARGTPAAARDAKPAIGLTMFGVTTPCVTQVAEALRGEFDCLTFHATGTGGQSMEKLAESGLLIGAIDVTTTEVCDLLMGGIFPCTEDRFGAFARTKLPYVGSCGALDMVNFAARETVPERYRDRTLYVHNPQITLMRTTAAENRRMGEWIATRLNACDGPVRFLIPEGGVSMLDAPGKAFHDPAADAALFEALERTWRASAQRQLVRLPFHINDPRFAAALAAAFRAIAGAAA